LAGNIFVLSENLNGILENKNYEIEHEKYLQLLVQEKNIRFILPDGTLKANLPATDSMLQIGCKIFDVTRVPSVIIPEFS